MARRLDKILVVDIEATCWDTRPPRGEECEIIEVGICALDVATGERMNRQSILVRPVRSRVSPFCTELTTLTQEQVDSGVNFERACEIIEDQYESRDRLWASFGDYDRRQFERQCLNAHIPYPFGPPHLNVKSLHAILFGLQHEVGMADALRMLGLPLEGTHHRAHDDAWNIAAILSTLLLKARDGGLCAYRDSVSREAMVAGARSNP